jgi:hypothetical protein
MLTSRSQRANAWWRAGEFAGDGADPTFRLSVASRSPVRNGLASRPAYRANT